MRTQWILGVLGLVLGAQFSFAGGSRVGNGSGSGTDTSSSMSVNQIRSEKLGIELEVPYRFSKKIETSSTMQISGPPKRIVKVTGPEVVSQQIQVWSLESRYPELVNLKKDSFEKWFADREWTQLSNQSKCPQIQFGQNKGTMTAIVAWNASKGVAIAATNSTEGREALKEILKTIKTTDKSLEGCPWK